MFTVLTGMSILLPVMSSLYINYFKLLMTLNFENTIWSQDFSNKIHISTKSKINNLHCSNQYIIIYIVFGSG